MTTFLVVEFDIIVYNTLFFQQRQKAKEEHDRSLEQRRKAEGKYQNRTEDHAKQSRLHEIEPGFWML